jgi:SAM-dependent MidA family methyltransferase
VPSAADELIEAQRTLGRPLRFDEYLSLALYGAHGFYNAGGIAGRRGDFLTSPEVGPLFGLWWPAGSRPAHTPRPTDDRGGGGAGRNPRRSILLAAPQWRGRYVAVEVSAAQRERHPEGVQSLADLPQGPITGVIIANELLDNLPFRLAVYDGGWREAVVEVDAIGTANERLVAAPPEWAWLPTGAAHGARVPVQEAAGRWVTEAVGRLGAGTLLVFDYCAARTASLALRPWREWLRTYRGHERGAHYLREIGAQDITTEVCLDQLPRLAVRTGRGPAALGHRTLVEEGRQREPPPPPGGAAHAASAQAESLLARASAPSRPRWRP